MLNNISGVKLPVHRPLHAEHEVEEAQHPFDQENEESHDQCDRERLQSLPEDVEIDGPHALVPWSADAALATRSRTAGAISAARARLVYHGAVATVSCRGWPCSDA
jgi:hypothetical protein